MADCLGFTILSPRIQCSQVHVWSKVHTSQIILVELAGTSIRRLWRSTLLNHRHAESISGQKKENAKRPLNSSRAAVFRTEAVINDLEGGGKHGMHLTVSKENLIRMWVRFGKRFRAQPVGLASRSSSSRADFHMVRNVHTQRLMPHLDKLSKSRLDGVETPQPLYQSEGGMLEVVSRRTSSIQNHRLRRVVAAECYVVADGDVVSDREASRMDLLPAFLMPRE
jgi:hypothetical protein